MPGDADINPADRGEPPKCDLKRKQQLIEHLRTLEEMAHTESDAVCRATMVVIPALNEADSISSVVATLRCWPFAGIRVVDNGSRDDTRKAATVAGAEVIYEPTRGYGAACWSGMNRLPAHISWILFCDGDGSDDLWSLRPFFEKAAEGYDLVLGNRNAFAEGRCSLSPAQRFGNALAGRLIGWRWKTRFQDLGPLRLIRRRCLTTLEMEDRGFGWTVEMQAKAARQGLRCMEIPVRYHKRIAGRSKISGTVSGSVRAGAIILGTIGRLALKNPSR